MGLFDGSRLFIGYSSQPTSVFLSLSNIQQKSFNFLHVCLHSRNQSIHGWKSNLLCLLCSSHGNSPTQRYYLFTDTAAMRNLLDLRSIMGCPGGTRSVFTSTFRAKRELQCTFLGKKAIIITSKHGTTTFFSHYNLFLGKLKEKLARKAHLNTYASISDHAHAPWASHNTP